MKSKKQIVASLPESLRLDLGCGLNPKQGFKGVDMIQFPGVDFVLDLRKPWPWKNE